jgi:hypothetical protein
MRSLTLLGRLGLPAVLTGLALTVAGPALAAPSTPPTADPSVSAEPSTPSGPRPSSPGDPDGPEVPWVLADQPWVVNIAGNHKALPIVVTNESPVVAHGVTVTIDASAATTAFTVDLPGAAQGCVVTGTIAECTIAELAPSAGRKYTVDLGPGADRYGEGRITVTTTATGMPGEETQETILQRAEPGVDMVIAGIDDMLLKPGQSAPVPVAVKNEGDASADGTVLIIGAMPYIETPNPYSNCERFEDFEALYCFFDSPLPPGEVFTIDPSTPLTVTVAADAPGPYDYSAFVGVGPVSSVEEDFAAKVAKKKGPELKLVPLVSAAAEELNDFDNFTDFEVTVPRTVADSAAVGATIAGAVGDTRTIEVGIRNNGPADTLMASQEWALSAYVVLPEDVEPLKVDDNCVPTGDNGPEWESFGKVDGSDYVCYPAGPVDKGATTGFAFTVKITGSRDNEGAIYVDGGAQDDNDSNTVASIPLKVSGGTGGGDGGSLPITGAPAAMIAGGGALLLIGGAAAFVVARRRRIVTVVE